MGGLFLLLNLLSDYDITIIKLKSEVYQLTYDVNQTKQDLQVSRRNELYEKANNRVLHNQLNNEKSKFIKTNNELIVMRLRVEMQSDLIKNMEGLKDMRTIEDTEEIEGDPGMYEPGT